jgi:hypothetical protein
MSHLSTAHAYRGGQEWFLAADGVHVGASGEVPRTAGSPVTATTVITRYGDAVRSSALQHGVPDVLIYATICTESQGKPTAIRREPGYPTDQDGDVGDNAAPNRVSPGLMQTLLSTARSVMGDQTIGRDWLFEPANSIEAGTRYLVSGRRSSKTAYDPVLASAAYNAGSLRPSASNLWGSVHTTGHVDRFLQWYDDCVAVLASTGAAVEMPDDVHYQHGWRACTTCGCLFHDSVPDGCVAGPHTPGDTELSVLHQYGAAHAQDGWRWCQNCSGLFISGAGTACWIGGTHDDTTSGDYAVHHNIGDNAPGVGAFRWCTGCGRLAASAVTSGCPAGDQHDFGSSGDYHLLPRPEVAS